MSRLAKNPIAIPEKVEFEAQNDTITVKGPKGELKKPYRAEIVTIKTEDGNVLLSIERNDTFARSLWGTYASHITNMFHGVLEGYEKELIVEGVGYRVNLKGSTLEMQLGYSHPVELEVPKELDVTVEKNKIKVSGIDKEQVGWFAAEVRSKRKPEPYKGKGIRYTDEQIIRKEGKRAA